MGALTSGVLLIGSRSIAPPLFDPVGSAAIPIACAVGLICLCVGVLVQGLVSPKQSSDATLVQATRPATVAALLLMASYVFSMNIGLRYAFATTLFVLIVIPVIGRSWRLLPAALMVALALGFGSEWLFTRLFYVDLPGAR